MVFEELQEADQALLDFIAHLLEWGRFPLVVVADSRPDPRVARLAATERIELGPLTPDEMDALVRGTVRAAPEPLLATVRADSGAVPLYAIETLRALADRGVLAVAEGRYVVRGEVGQVAVPPTIRALIAALLDGLGAIQRKILSAGAVIGERFTLKAAAAVADVDVLDATALLSGLVARAFLAIEGDQRSDPRNRYRFLQGVVRPAHALPAPPRVTNQKGNRDTVTPGLAVDVDCLSRTAALGRPARAVLRRTSRRAGLDSRRLRSAPSA